MQDSSGPVKPGPAPASFDISYTDTSVRKFRKFRLDCCRLTKLTMPPSFDSRPVQFICRRHNIVMQVN